MLARPPAAARRIASQFAAYAAAAKSQAVLLSWSLLTPLPSLQPVTFGMIAFFFRMHAKARRRPRRRLTAPPRLRALGRD